MQFSLTDAAHVLGMLPWEAEEILGAGPYELDAVEQAALEHYRPHAHARDPYSYWVTTTQAAAILGISDVRVKQLLNAEKIPFQRHRSGKRLMRRHPVRVIGNARSPASWAVALGADRLRDVEVEVRVDGTWHPAGSIPTTDAGRVRAAGRATSVRPGAPRCSH
jgi:hypothetical protein